MSRIRRRNPVPLLLCGLLAAEACGNGINPPRPSGSRTVEAACTDRKSGNVTTVHRARMAIDEPSGSLELRAGESPARTVQLAEVVRIQIPSAKTAADGFAKAFIELRAPNYKGPGHVRLRAKAKPVRLVGFTANLERLDVPLETCRELAFKASTSSEAENGGVRGD